MRTVLYGWLFAFVALQVPALAGAQSLVTGRWSGSGTDPSGNVKPVSYTVAGSGDSLTITLFDPPTGMSVPFRDVRLAADSLFFNWAGGRNQAPLACKLVRQPDGAFEGSCSDPEGNRGRMLMRPPGKP